MEVIERVFGGLGASQIGSLFTKDGLKAKTAQSLALEKAEEIINGCRKEFTTAPMQHGLYNEEEAFESIVKPSFPTAVYQSDQPILIKKFSDDAIIWATPDAVDYDAEITFDIKCPYTISTYFRNVKKMPETYMYQNQMQMLATGHSQGYVVMYLTSNVHDEYGNKIEYDIDINDRHIFKSIIADDTTQDEILKRAEEFFSMRDKLLNDLQNANEISDKEYFELAKSDHSVSKLKDKSNLLTWGGRIFKNEREGYLVIE